MHDHTLRAPVSLGADNSLYVSSLSFSNRLLNSIYLQGLTSSAEP